MRPKIMIYSLLAAVQHSVSICNALIQVDARVIILAVFFAAARVERGARQVVVLARMRPVAQRVRRTRSRERSENESD